MPLRGLGDEREANDGTKERGVDEQVDAVPEVAGQRPHRPALVVFDVNETLSDMSPMAARFVDVGAPGSAAATWFAGLLRDGFALTAAGASPSFAEIGAGLLRVQLTGVSLDRGMDVAVEHIMEGFRSLALHPDVVPGVAALSDLGLRLVTLSNGSASVAEGLFERAGVRERFEQVLSVEGVAPWKPAPDAYRSVLRRCGAAASETMLVAVHPWDVDGAGRSGLITAWLNRSGAPYPSYFRRPDLEVASLVHLAELLA